MSALDAIISAMHLLIALFALAGTLLQTATSMRETGRANKPVVDDWLTEDELVAQVPTWKKIERWKTKRQLVHMRTDEEHRVIKHLNRVILGWVLLDVAAIAAVVDAIA